MRVVLLPLTSLRSSAETMPWVTVFASTSPPGLPMATTVLPTIRLLEEPMVAGTSCFAASPVTCSTARSREESEPASVASAFSPLGSSTWKLSPPSTTW